MSLLPRGAREALRTAGVVGVAAVCIASTRAGVAQTHRKVKETSDVYALPPPAEVVRLSLGYRAALADVLWAHVLVSQGLHTMARRRYDNLTRLLDTINELDPTFRDPYMLADALITFQAEAPSHAEIVKARELMERGVRERPLDGELWLALGQFVGFIAPGSYLKDPAEQEAWRRAGAAMLARAAELSGSDANIGWQALGGAGILGRAGERDAQIRFLQRTMAITDDEELKAYILAQLERLLGERELEAHRQRQESFRDLWKRDLPFVRLKTTVLVLGPPRDTARCAGRAELTDPACASTWREWSERLAGPP